MTEAETYVDSLVCPKCGEKHEFKIITKGVHTCVYCGLCGAFIRWLKNGMASDVQEVINRRLLRSESKAQEEYPECPDCDKGQDYIIPMSYGAGGIDGWYVTAGNYCPSCGRPLKGAKR